MDLPKKSFSEVHRPEELCDPSTWHRYTWAYIGTCTCGKIVAAAVTVAFPPITLHLASETFLPSHSTAGQHSDTRECTAETKRSVAAISSTLHYRTAVERPNTPPSKKSVPAPAEVHHKAVSSLTEEALHRWVEVLALGAQRLYRPTIERRVR